MHFHHAKVQFKETSRAGSKKVAKIWGCTSFKCKQAKLTANFSFAEDSNRDTFCAHPFYSIISMRMKPIKFEIKFTKLNQVINNFVSTL